MVASAMALPFLFGFGPYLVKSASGMTLKSSFHGQTGNRIIDFSVRNLNAKTFMGKKPKITLVPLPKKVNSGLKVEGAYCPNFIGNRSDV